MERDCNLYLQQCTEKTSQIFAQINVCPEAEVDSIIASPQSCAQFSCCIKIYDTSAQKKTQYARYYF